jgi:MFS family permease
VPATGTGAIRHVLAHPGAPASRLIWIYTIAIGAFYGTIQTSPLLLGSRLGVTEHTIGYFIMYLGALGVVVRTLVLGRMVDAFGEMPVARLGLATLAVGLALTGIAHDLPAVIAGFTLMPIGTGLVFPCITGMLSQAVRVGERGLYMGVQHTFGGVSRVAFPVAAGFLMDAFGVGVPFWLSAVLVVATLPLARAWTGTGQEAPAAEPARQLARTDLTGDLPAGT